MKEYELTYIVRPDMEDEAVATLSARFEQTITSNGGRVIKTDHWGKRRLAYPIRRYSEGNYILLHTELTDKASREVQRQIKLSEDVLRHLLVCAEPVQEAAPEPEPPAPAAPPTPPTLPAQP